MQTKTMRTTEDAVVASVSAVLGPWRRRWYSWGMVWTFHDGRTELAYDRQRDELHFYRKGLEAVIVFAAWQHHEGDTILASVDTVGEALRRANVPGLRI